VLDLSPEKILVLGVIALIFLGPNRLPQAARSLGHFVAQMRRMSQSFQTEVRDAMAEPNEFLSSTLPDLRPGEIRRTVRNAVTSAIVPPATPGSSPVAQSSPNVQINPVPVVPPTVPPAERSAILSAPDDPSLN
jgi:sec-independent protein translocase protein TatB